MKYLVATVTDSYLCYDGLKISFLEDVDLTPILYMMQQGLAVQMLALR